ncbi:hypothetical protein ACSW8S_18600 (plasmid) [Clostridium perfringens]
MSDKNMDLKYKKFKEKFVDMIIFMKENGMSNLNINVSQLGIINQDICDVAISYVDTVEEFVYILGTSDYKGMCKPQSNKNLKTETKTLEKTTNDAKSKSEVSNHQDKKNLGELKSEEFDKRDSYSNTPIKKNQSDKEKDKVKENNFIDKKEASEKLNNSVKHTNERKCNIPISDLIENPKCLLKERTFKTLPKAESIFNKYTPPVDKNSLQGEQFTLI